MWPNFQVGAGFACARAKRWRSLCSPDGVPPNEIYPMDLDRAFKSLERIKPHIRKWIEQTQQTVSLVQTGELDFSYTYLNRAKAARDAGISLDFSQDQLVVYGSYYVVPKVRRTKDAAMKYLAFLLRPDRGGSWVVTLG